MIRSMTGYGRAQGSDGKREVSVELKSVNHRYFDFSARLPRGYGFLEEKIRAYLQSIVIRGKIDLYLDITVLESEGAQVHADERLAGAYAAALRELQDTHGLAGGLTLDTVARFPGVLIAEHGEEDEDAVWAAVLPVLAEACGAFTAMREREGARLRDDVLSRADSIAEQVTAVEARAPESAALYRAKLEARVRELLQGAAVDEQRLLTETAVFADRIAVDEETVRLRSHLAQIGEILSAGGEAGKKLDFLVQEMNREANTIGSKAQDLAVTQCALAMKGGIEKIREQVQNIE